MIKSLASTASFGNSAGASSSKDRDGYLERTASPLILPQIQNRGRKLSEAGGCLRGNYCNDCDLAVGLFVEKYC